MSSKIMKFICGIVLTIVVNVAISGAMVLPDDLHKCRQNCYQTVSFFLLTFVRCEFLEFLKIEYFELNFFVDSWENSCKIKEFSENVCLNLKYSFHSKYKHC